MNPNWSDAETWIDIIDHIIIGLVVVLAAGIPSWMTAKTNKAMKAETKVIRDQLVNGHTTYMRADLDRALAAIESLAEEISHLRKDLSLEQTSRRSQIDDLRGDVDRMRRRP